MKDFDAFQTSGRFLKDYEIFDDEDEEEELDNEEDEE
jgi:hypothetical protein